MMRSRSRWNGLRLGAVGSACRRPRLCHGRVAKGASAWFRHISSAKTDLRPPPEKPAAARFYAFSPAPTTSRTRSGFFAFCPATPGEEEANRQHEDRAQDGPDVLGMGDPAVGPGRAAT